MNSSVKPENVCPVQITPPTCKWDVVTGETAAAIREAAPRPLVFQRSVCTRVQITVHTHQSGETRPSRGSGVGGPGARLHLLPSQKKTQKTGGRAGTAAAQGGSGKSRRACAAQGQGEPGPLTSTRRPMLAMCGEQSLTVSSFSICRDTLFSQRKLQLQKAA